MIDSTIQMINLLALIVFVSSIGAQGWIAFLDIANFFTNKLERYRPRPSQDKYSRIVVIVGIFVILMD